jgi:pimeloyl-ACP methyl ester carboxylesterase
MNPHMLAAALSVLVASGNAQAAEPAGLSTEMTLDSAAGALHGTLTLPPDSRGRVPVVLIVPGSGPTDRDGNSKMLPGKNDAYKLLAEGLAQRGVASLRYDKRLPRTQAEESAFRFDVGVDDAASWVKKLAANPRFRSVTIAGHSEGSLVGMVAAQRSPAGAFVSLEGAGRPAAAVLREQLGRQNPDGKPDPQVERLLASLEAGSVVRDLPAGLSLMFPPSVQPYMISWFKYDPAQEIVKLTVPVTLIWGTADVQVTKADYDALAATPKARDIVVEGMNHVLKNAPDTSSSNAVLKGYSDPSLPVVPSVIDAVAAAAKSAAAT